MDNETIACAAGLINKYHEWRFGSRLADSAERLGGVTISHRGGTEFCAHRRVHFNDAHTTFGQIDRAIRQFVQFLGWETGDDFGADVLLMRLDVEFVAISPTDRDAYAVVRLVFYPKKVGPTQGDHAYAFLHGRKYVLGGISGVLRYEHDGGARLIHVPDAEGRMSAAYRRRRRELGDDFTTTLDYGTAAEIADELEIDWSRVEL